MNVSPFIYGDKGEFCVRLWLADSKERPYTWGAKQYSFNFIKKKSLKSCKGLNVTQNKKAKRIVKFSNYDSKSAVNALILFGWWTFKVVNSMLKMNCKTQSTNYSIINYKDTWQMNYQNDILKVF